jgi:hypothetical protein
MEVVSLPSSLLEMQIEKFYHDWFESNPTKPPHLLAGGSLFLILETAIPLLSYLPDLLICKNTTFILSERGLFESENLDRII